METPKRPSKMNRFQQFLSLFLQETDVVCIAQCRLQKWKRQVIRVHAEELVNAVALLQSARTNTLVQEKSLRQPAVLVASQRLLSLYSHSFSPFEEPAAPSSCQVFKSSNLQLNNPSLSTLVNTPLEIQRRLTYPVHYTWKKERTKDQSCLKSKNQVFWFSK